VTNPKAIDVTRKKLQAMDGSGATVGEMEVEMSLLALSNPNSAYSLIWTSYLAAHDQNVWLEKFLNYEIG